MFIFSQMNVDPEQRAGRMAAFQQHRQPLLQVRPIISKPWLFVRFTTNIDANTGVYCRYSDISLLLFPT
jgi:hypothetical protein